MTYKYSEYVVQYCINPTGMTSANQSIEIKRVPGHTRYLYKYKYAIYAYIILYMIYAHPVLKDDQGYSVLVVLVRSKHSTLNAVEDP